jgi:hypothetical protein
MGTALRPVPMKQLPHIDTLVLLPPVPHSRGRHMPESMPNQVMNCPNPHPDIPVVLGPGELTSGNGLGHATSLVNRRSLLPSHSVSESTLPLASIALSASSENPPLSTRYTLHSTLYTLHSTFHSCTPATTNVNVLFRGGRQVSAPEIGRRSGGCMRNGGRGAIQCCIFGGLPISCHWRWWPSNLRKAK